LIFLKRALFNSKIVILVEGYIHSLICNYTARSLSPFPVTRPLFLRQIAPLLLWTISNLPVHSKKFAGINSKLHSHPCKATLKILMNPSCTWNSDHLSLSGWGDDDEGGGSDCGGGAFDCRVRT
jgi:hypothetical protein